MRLLVLAMALNAAASVEEEASWRQKVTTRLDDAGVTSKLANTLSFVTEVKDSVAASTTAAVEQAAIDLQSSAFKFLKLSDEMISTLKMMLWNIATVTFLLGVSRYCSVDVTFVCVTVTFFTGSFLVALFLDIAATVLWLATWAPSLFLLCWMIVLFNYSKVGRVALRSCGVDPRALEGVPGYTYCAKVLTRWYAQCKPHVATVYNKLDDIEDAIGIEIDWTPERSVGERLDAIEGMLAKVLQSAETNAAPHSA